MKRMKPHTILQAFACTALVCLATCAVAAEAVVLYYNVIPPFKMKMPDGTVGGLALTPVQDAFLKAGIPFEWQEVPNLRQKALVTRSSASVCAVGIYKSDIRQNVGKFSAPVFRNQPLEVLLAKGVSAKGVRPDLKALFSDPNKNVVLIRGRSYGEYVDALISNATSRLDYANDAASIIKMLDLNHGDATVIEPEVINYHRTMSAQGVEALESYLPKDSPRGDYRYMFCSSGFPDGVLDKINRLLGGGRKGSPR